ncbi:MAG TPA: hypothetical protein VHM88_07160 [Candidatus Acidoferrales bacterium]|jgi:hypothetical protein|nr:hypothetical protein [Candidatus Acidoferrales bacterium]
MVILKLALLSSAFYLGIAIVLQAALVLVAYMDVIVGVAITRLGLGALFGVIWLVSFSLAWHIFYAGWKAKLPIPPN